MDFPCNDGYIMLSCTRTGTSVKIGTVTGFTGTVFKNKYSNYSLFSSIFNNSFRWIFHYSSDVMSIEGSDGMSAQLHQNWRWCKK